MIWVLGSINRDFVVEVETLPRPGETVSATGVNAQAGGKGANQAVGVARLGAAVSMIGCVGDESDREGLAAEGVNVAGVRVTDTPTGSAFITVGSDGNTIVVDSGANALVGEHELKVLSKGVAEGDTLLVQLEIPVPVVIEAVRIAREAGATVICDPTPAVTGFRVNDVWLTPNVTEAATILGVDEIGDLQAAAVRLLETGAGRVTVTAGAAGVFDTRAGHVAAPRVEEADPTAAGDAFNAALAVFEDLATACVAGSLAAAQEGSQKSLPTRGHLEMALNHAGTTPYPEKH